MSHHRNLSHKAIALNNKNQLDIISKLDSLVDDSTKTTSSVVYDNASVSANQLSTAQDIQKHRNHSLYGTSNGATTLEIHVANSESGTYYKSGTSISITAAGDFHSTFESMAKYIKIKTITAATLTMILSSKD